MNVHVCYEIILKEIEKIETKVFAEKQCNCNVKYLLAIIKFWFCRHRSILYCEK